MSSQNQGNQNNLITLWILFTIYIFKPLLFDSNYHLQVKYLMIKLIENVLETLYTYQQSVYYRIHLIAIFVVGIVLANIIFREWKMKKQEDERPVSKCSSKIPYFDYVTTTQKNTQEALSKLESSR